MVLWREKKFSVIETVETTAVATKQRENASAKVQPQGKEYRRMRKNTIAQVATDTMHSSPACTYSGLEWSAKLPFTASVVGAAKTIKAISRQSIASKIVLDFN